MDPATVGPLEWLGHAVNWQGLILAELVAFCMSAANVLDRQAGLGTVLAGVVLAAVLTFIAIPLAVFIFHLSWPYWSLIGLAMGVASLRVRRGLDALAALLEQRLPTAAADRVTAIVGGQPSPPNAGGKTSKPGDPA